MELVSSAFSLALEAHEASVGQGALVGVSIPQPLVLPAMQMDQSPTLECTFSMSTGSVVASSGEGPETSRHVHFAGRLGKLLHAGGGQMGAHTSVSHACTLGVRVSQRSFSPSIAVTSRDKQRGMLVDPAMMDSVLQLSTTADPDGESMKVPAGFGAFAFPHRSSTHQRTLARTHPSSAGKEGNASVSVHDFMALKPSGEEFVRLHGMVAKSFGQASAGPRALAASRDCMYQLRWTVSSPLADCSGRAFQTPRLLQGAQKGGGSNAALGSTFLQVLQLASLSVHLVTPEEASLVGYRSFSNARDLSGMLPSLLWSMLRTKLKEQPSCKATGVQSCLLDGAQALHLFFGSRAPEDHYGMGYSGRASAQAKLLHVPFRCHEEAFQLLPAPRGSFSGLQTSPLQGVPGTYKAVVRVMAVGINFRDVLNVLGMYPGDPGAPGADFAGFVSHGSPGFHLGSSVLGLAAGALASHVSVNPLACALVPSTVSFEEAATMPTVFVTADLTLGRGGNLGVRDRVLIQAASGGVGLASGQVTRARGGQVVGTAGSPGKRSLLRQLGVHEVGSSRDTSFTELCAWNGGVDLVLNSLTSPGMVSGSLSVLTPGGCFCEIGKRDIWSTGSIRMERADVGYQLVAVDFLPPSVHRHALQRLASLLGQGWVHPLIHTCHSLGSTAEALRQMSKARHVGKVVVHDASCSAMPLSGGVLITGGTGSLGSLAAAWAMERGSRSITLVGRGGRSAMFLPPSDSCVSVFKGDTSFGADVHAIACLRAFSCLLHASGLLADGMLDSQSRSSVYRAFGPKVAGMQGLNLATASHPVGEMVAFSSIAALLGSPGQANYAAANAALDSLASTLKTQGRCAHSVQWGAWDSGMALRDKSTMSRLHRLGLGALSVSSGLGALGALLSSDLLAMGTSIAFGLSSLVAVSPFAWPNFLKTQPGEAKTFDEFEAPKDTISQHKGTEEQIAALPAASALLLPSAEALLASVTSVVGSILGQAPAPDEPLLAAGLDSLSAVEVRNSLEQRFQVELPGTLVFDYPSLRAIGGFVHDSLQSAVGVQEEQANVQAPVGKHRPDTDPTVATCARMSTRLPQRSSVASCADHVQVVDPCRWDVDAWKESPNLPARFSVNLPEVDMFDASLFSISGREATVMDPQQRLLLETALETLGLTPVQYGFGAGVFVGIATADYNAIVRNCRFKIDTHTATGSTLSVACGRISYVYGLKGPSLSVDTACSSSLVGMHLGYGSMCTGGCVQALCFGVSLTLLPEVTQMFNVSGMLALDGRCKTLDAAANGYVRAEACASILLESQRPPCGPASLSQGACALVATHVNQDGRSSSLTAPNGPSQQEVILGALSAASTAPYAVNGIQMHGTGTSLGDPIEVGAIAAILLRDAAANRSIPLALTAGKSSMGHAETAAGLVGVAKAAFTLWRSKLPSISHLRNVNPYVEQALRSAPSASSHAPRQVGSLSINRDACLSGVSSFAFQGTNAHGVLARSADMQQLAPPAYRVFSMPLRPISFYALPRTFCFMKHFCRTEKETVFSVSLGRPGCSFVLDHAVLGRVIFPGAGYMELVSSAFSLALEAHEASVGQGALVGVSIPQPLVLPAMQMDQSPTLECTFSMSTGSVVASSGEGPETSRHVHFAGRLGKLLHAGGGQMGAHTSVSHACTLGVRVSQRSFSPSIAVTSRDKQRGMLVDPAMMDSVLQLSTTADPDGESMKVPAGFGAFAFPHRSSTHQRTLARTHPSSAGKEGNASVSVHDFMALKPSGEEFVRLHGMVAKSFGQASAGPRALAASRDCMYQLRWTVSSPLADCSGRAFQTPRLLQGAQKGGGSNAALGSTFLQVLQLASLSVHLVTPEEASLVGYRSFSNARDLSGMLPSLLWSMLRTKLKEQPSCKATGVQSCLLDGAQALHLFFGSRAPEDHYGMGYSGRASAQAKLLHVPFRCHEEAFQLLPAPRGSFSGLQTSPLQGVPGTYKAVVRVMAVGINFRDVLNVLGMYPGDPGAPGADFAGFVSHGSPGFHLGSSVLGLAAGALASHVSVNPLACALVPSTVSFEEAATMPTVFVTADLTLGRGGNLGVRDRVLIQAASGGVGLASGQVTRARGGQVVGTAGSPGKRSLLRQLGVHEVGSSRDTSFTELCAWNGGVDLVLNSLTSPGMVSGSLSVLTPGGCFCEIGKRDIWSTGSIRMERADVGYQLVAVDFLPPSVHRHALQRLASLLGQGWVHPLIHTCHSLGSTAEALRQMSKARHVGKVVVHDASCSAMPLSGGVLITGGTGSLGSLAAAWAMERGSRSITLVGRGGRSAMFLPPSDSCVSVFKGDTSFGADVHAIACLRAFSCLLHASGLLADGMLDSQSRSSVYRAFGPKVAGMQGLNLATASHPVGEMVAFSSIAALLGSPGQANYAAANAALDSLASTLKTQGRCAHSVQWGAWDSGMALRDKSTMSRLHRLGLGALSVSSGLGALGALLSSDLLAMGTSIAFGLSSLVAVSPFAWPNFLKTQPGEAKTFDEFEAPKDTISQHKGTEEQIAALPAASALLLPSAEALLASVTSVVGSILGQAPAPDEPLLAAGLDSLSAVEVRNSLEQRFQVELPGTLVFDYPSLRAIGGFVHDSLQSAVGVQEEQANVQAPVGKHRPDTDPTVATCARMSTRLPQRSSVASCADHVQVVDPCRWDVDAWKESPNLPARFSVNLPEVDMFDASLFSISGREATVMDPQQRLLLETALETLGLTPVQYGFGAGVFVGIATADYNAIVRNCRFKIDTHTATGSTLSVACGRISYVYGLKGPSLSVDTACSSSLVGMHLGYGSMCTGGCVQALCFGVSLTLLPEVTQMFNVSGMLALDGRCKTLDAAANGYVRAEACASILLESQRPPCGPASLSQGACALVATHVNQDGRSSSLTAPNGPSQQEVILGALSAASTAPYAVNGIQMHGTGTSLGDPIEVGAIAAILLRDAAANRSIPLALTAGKSSMGHAETAAGLVGVAKAAFTLWRSKLPSISHLRNVNPYVEQALRSAPSASSHAPRQVGSLSINRDACLSGVSSFAFQGTNAHGIFTDAGSPSCIPETRYSFLRKNSFWVHEVVSAPLAFSPVTWVEGKPVLEVFLSHQHFGYLWDSSLGGKCVLPCSFSLSLAAFFASSLIKDLYENVCLCDTVVESTVELPRPGKGHVVLRCSVKQRDRTVELSSTCGTRLLAGNFVSVLPSVQGQQKFPPVSSTLHGHSTCAPQSETALVTKSVLYCKDSSHAERTVPFIISMKSDGEKRKDISFNITTSASIDATVCWLAISVYASHGKQNWLRVCRNDGCSPSRKSSLYKAHSNAFSVESAEIAEIADQVEPSFWDRYQEQRTNRDNEHPFDTNFECWEREILSCLNQALDKQSNAISLGQDVDTTRPMYLLNMRGYLSDKCGFWLPWHIFSGISSVENLKGSVLAAIQEGKLPLNLPAMLNDEMSNFRNGTSSTTSRGRFMKRPSAFLPALRLLKVLSWTSSKRRERYGANQVKVTPMTEAKKAISFLSWDDMIYCCIKSQVWLSIPGAFDISKLQSSFARALDAFPSLAGRFTHKKGMILLKYGGKKSAVPFTVVPMEASSTEVEKCSSNKALDERICTVLGADPLRDTWQPLPSLFFEPALSIFASAGADSGSSRQVGNASSMLRIVWNRGIADPTTMCRFVECWAAFYRGLRIVETLPLPHQALDLWQRSIFCDELMHSGWTVDELASHKKSIPSSFMLSLSCKQLDELQELMPHELTQMEVVGVYLWAVMLDSVSEVSKNDTGDRVPVSLTLLEDLRNGIPQLGQYIGNLQRARPLCAAASNAEKNGINNSVPYHKSAAMLHKLGSMLLKVRLDNPMNPDALETGQFPGYGLGVLQETLRHQSAGPCLVVNTLSWSSVTCTDARFDKALGEFSGTSSFSDMEYDALHIFPALATNPVWQAQIVQKLSGGVCCTLFPWL